MEQIEQKEKDREIEGGERGEEKGIRGGKGREGERYVLHHFLEKNELGVVWSPTNLPI